MEHKIRVYHHFVVDIVATVILSFLCISFLITGVIYPVDMRDQQLLMSWGIESFYGLILTMLLLIPMLITIFAYHRSINGMLERLKFQNETSISRIRSLFQIFPGWIGIAVLAFWGLFVLFGQLIYQTTSLTHHSTVIFNILFYPLSGFIIGQTLTKMVKILVWEHRNSAKVYCTSDSKLVRH